MKLEDIRRNWQRSDQDRYRPTRKFFLSQRVVNGWNSLPADVENA